MKVYTDIKDQYAGKWKSIHSYIGIDNSLLSGKHTDCPLCCSEGSNRFRYENKNGRGNYFCNQCGHGSAIDLIMGFLNLGYIDTIKYVRTLKGDFKMESFKTNDDVEINKAKLEKVKSGLKKITPDSPAALYFAKRGITVLPDKNCYIHPSLDYWDFNEETKKVVSLGKFPVIVSILRDINNNTCTYELLYITTDGLKADVPSNKKMMKPVIQMAGCSVHLWDAKDILCIAEGLETALSTHLITGHPVWATGSSNNLEKVIIPDGVKQVIIVTDEDNSWTGQKSAYILANRLQIKKDIKIQVYRFLNGELYIDDGGNGFDANDYIILKAAA